MNPHPAFFSTLGLFLAAPGALLAQTTAPDSLPPHRPAGQSSVVIRQSGRGNSATVVQSGGGKTTTIVHSSDGTNTTTVEHDGQSSVTIEQRDGTPSAASPNSGRPAPKARRRDE